MSAVKDFDVDINIVVVAVVVPADVSESRQS
jgi:hypothetical protein